MAARSRDGCLVASWSHPRERRPAARTQSVADSKSSGCGMGQGEWERPEEPGKAWERRGREERGWTSVSQVV